MALSRLKKWPRNPKAHDMGQLDSSFQRWGFTNPIMIDEGTRQVVAGHGRIDGLVARKNAGKPAPDRIIIRGDEWFVPVIRGIEFKNAKEAEAYLLADNQLTILGGFDDKTLADMLRDHTVNLTGLGWDQDTVQRILYAEAIPELDPPRQKSPELTLVPYMGGKQKLVPQLLSLIPPHTSYVEVFGGGGALLLNKPPSAIEVYNDIDGELVNLFEVIRDNPDAFLKRADFLLYSRELYEKWTDEIQKGSGPKDPAERALRFWYCLRCSFGAHIEKGWAFSTDDPRDEGLVLANALAKIRTIHERLKNVEIDHLDFRRLIPNRDSPSTFMFLDPPYLDAEEYRTGKFTLQDHRDLAEALKHAQGKWLMTVGDHPEIRALYPATIRGKLTSSMQVEQVFRETGARSILPHLIVSNYELPS